MAGTYPDVPGQRMAYDRDGSTLVRAHRNLGTSTSLSGIDTMNSEGSSGANIASGETSNDSNFTAVVIFPELRDIDGIWDAAQISANAGNSISYAGLYWSADTTNGVDGSWTLVSSSLSGSYGDKTSMRDDIRSDSLSGVKALGWRVTGSGTGGRTFNIQAQVYGAAASGEAPDRLLFYDSSTATEVTGAHFDLGDIARSSSSTVDFRVHNPSASLTANTVTVTMEALTDTSPSNVGQFEFSTDGGSTWASTASLGNLSAGSTSTTITLRRTTSGSAVLGLWWTRLVASASSWS